MFVCTLVGCMGCTSTNGSNRIGVEVCNGEKGLRTTAQFSLQFTITSAKYSGSMTRFDKTKSLILQPSDFFIFTLNLKLNAKKYHVGIIF